MLDSDPTVGGDRQSGLTLEGTLIPAIDVQNPCLNTDGEVLLLHLLSTLISSAAKGTK